MYYPRGLWMAEATRTEAEVEIPTWKTRLKGTLVVPENARGIVVFSHGSGSSRFSPRNSHVAGMLREKKLGTLLIDLLTEEEDTVYENRFDIRLLTERLAAVVQWLRNQPMTEHLNIGLFGASTGAASALRVAARMPGEIKAVVSRGGRPDLAPDALPRVKAPTLLIAGGLDRPVVEMNRRAFAALLGKSKELTLVEGATHLFEEPGKLDQVAQLAANWFEQYLVYKYE